MPLIHYYTSSNLYFMAFFFNFISDEETSKTWAYSVLDKACLTAGHNHTSYEVVEGMNPPTREEKNNITHMNSHIKIIQLVL